MNDKAYLEAELKKRIQQLEEELKEAGKGFEAQRKLMEKKREEMEEDYTRQIAELKALQEQ